MLFELSGNVRLCQSSTDTDWLQKLAGQCDSNAIPRCKSGWPQLGGAKWLSCNNGNYLCLWLSSYTHDYLDKEISFILAHELAHLFNNHLIGTLFWYLVEQLDIGSNNQNYYYVQLAKIIFTVTSPDFVPPNVLLLRNREYDADAFAVRYITHDLSIASSCLRKLSGGNLNGPSHKWELIGHPLPAMTLQHRTTN